MTDLRFVVDDSSLALPGSVSTPEVESALERLSDHLAQCRDRRERVGIISGYDLIEVLPGVLLSQLLTDGPVSRDTRLRAYGLLDKCARLDSDPGFYLEPSIRVNGATVSSYGLAHASDRARQRHAVGVLCLFPAESPGPVTVDDLVGQSTAYLIADDESLLRFYRAIFEIEDVPESEFFDFAVNAFPRLTFVPTLSFRKFEGEYEVLRQQVVSHLSAINDRFHSALAKTKGLADQMSSELGIDVSLENNTRQSERLMRLRDVEYLGRTYRCEWHSKLEPHRNRIHLHPGDETTNECALIGIFVDHLPT